jgi:hypothetical protein
MMLGKVIVGVIHHLLNVGSERHSGTKVCLFPVRANT